jgi:hypothetical protein
MDVEERRRWQNDRRMIRFYESLEGVLKRHDPVEYILAMSARLRQCRDDEKKWRQTPPFRAVHSVEASCAFARGHSRDPVTLNRIFRAMNIYHEHNDPMQHDVLASSFPHFMLLMHREQMELQYTHSHDDLGRIVAIYGQTGSLRRSSRAFRERFMLTPRQWIRLCFLTATAAERDPCGFFVPESIIDYIRQNNLPEDIPDEAVRSFLALSSRTPRQIGARFREERAKLPRYLHSSIRSALLETPLIAIGADAPWREGMVLMVRDLMFRHGGEALYRLMKGLDNFDQEIGDAVEGYVGRVLASFEGLVSLHGEEPLKTLVGGKCCDFLLELPGEILLVEVKAVSFIKTVLTENSVATDTSTRRIAEGIRQLYATAHELHTGRFETLGIDKTKPVMGIVVTLGDIPLVNTKWYFETFIMALASPKLEPPIYPSPNLARRPVSMTVRTLEQLVMVCSSLGRSLTGLYSDWCAQPELTVGDWDAYLNQIVRDNYHAVRSLPFIRPQTVELLVSLGVPPDIVEGRMDCREGAA